MATDTDAGKFAEHHDGQALSFAKVSIDMADLSGGAIHDKGMQTVVKGDGTLDRSTATTTQPIDRKPDSSH